MYLVGIFHIVYKCLHFLVIFQVSELLDETMRLGRNPIALIDEISEHCRGSVEQIQYINIDIG